MAEEQCQLTRPHANSHWTTVRSASIHEVDGFPGGSDSKESACNSGDLSLIPGSGRSPGEGNGYPLQYSCLENSMNIGAWQSTVPIGSQRVKRLSD